MKFHPKYKLTGKIAAFLMTILMFSLTLGCILTGFVFADEGLYSLTKNEYLEELYRPYIGSDFNKIFSIIPDEQLLTDDQLNKIATLCAERNFASVKIWENDSEDPTFNWSNEKAVSGPTQTRDFYTLAKNPDGGNTKFTVQISIAEKPLLIEDDYQEAYRLTSFLYTMRIVIYPIAIVALLAAIFCFIYLMIASGRHYQEAEIRAGWGTAIPLDLLTVCAGFVTLVLLSYATDFFDDCSDPKVLILVILAVIASETILIGWSMSFALRTKLGKWWKNTLIFHLCTLFWKLLKHIIKCAIKLFHYIPFIWKTVIAIAVVTLSELFFLVIVQDYHVEEIVFWWIAEKIILIPLGLYIAIVLYKLKKGGHALAAGDLNHPIDTQYMLWDFKEHGENLNNISNGMSLAVEERLKSERLKTELITNVSHDIKTPLTSIINYTDLIAKETIQKENDSENTTYDMEKIHGYASVLLRQSERMKHLIENLIEVSKAATGNLEVNLEPCEASILLTQAAGEYEQRFTSAGLTLITKQPEESIPILADSRRLWRIFDNLLNNICKYAQPQTRVYLTLEKQENFAVITFKNVSRDALDVSENELMERFVRGDASRHTEGNGLGLSIAKSLTELQKGTMQLAIDGDLFKVTLRFPILN